MRVVVSGTHASGKSTLIADFGASHAEYVQLPDPFEFIDDYLDQPNSATFFAQLVIAAERLRDFEPGMEVLVERGPLDFLAYLMAHDTLGRGSPSGELFDRGRALTAATMRRVDLLVLLPLNPHDRIWVPRDEDPELREVMNDKLLELTDDVDLVGEQVRIVEIVGDREKRLSALEVAIAEMPT